MTNSWVSANLLGGIDSSNPADADVRYNYTGDLKRVWRIENEVLTNIYQWDAGFNVLNEFSNVNPMKSFVPGLAEVSGNAPATNATYNYLSTDHLGSTRGMWNGSIAQTGNWEFTPYGGPYNFAGPPDVTQLYTGHDLDRATGQYYAPFRYLNPNLGRWTASDPIGMANGTNMFAYVGLDPVGKMDPLGLVDSLQTEGGRVAWGYGPTPPMDPVHAAAYNGFWAGAGQGTLQVADSLPTPTSGALKFLNLYNPDAPGMHAGKVACEVGLSAAAGAGGAAFAAPVIKSGPIRMGPWYTYKGSTEKVWRIAFGSKKSFIHGHIHGANWYKPWRWFQKIGKWTWYD